MKQEYGVKILNINPAEAVAKLQAMGGKIRFGPSLLKTAFFDHQKLKLREQGIPIRVRSIGEKTFLNVKHAAGPAAHQDPALKTLSEIEVAVEDFAKICELLKTAGFYPFRYQEKKRTSFTLPGVRVELEQYPAIPAYLELEGETAEATKRLVEQLGFELDQTVKLSATEVLKKAGIEHPDLVRFDDSEPLPDYLVPRKVNSIAEADRKVEEVLWERD